jgi:regulator of protease activity HflC (stomatin/prohibitin superfamily)
MFGFILGIIIFIATIIGTCYCQIASREARATDETGRYKRDENMNYIYVKEYPFKKYSFIVVVIGLVITAIFIIGSMVHTVPTGKTGILTTFGKVENYTLDAGLNITAPWQNVILMDNQVQKETIDLTAFSSDIQEVSVKYTVNYQIDSKNAMNIYRSIGKNYFTKIIYPITVEAVKETTALYTAEALINSRNEVALHTEELIATRLAEYNIQLTGTAIEDMDFADVFTNAVEAKQVAQQNKLKAETEAQQKIVEANAAAEVRKVEAEAEAYETKVKAEAEAEANAKIAASITNTLIEYEYAQKWNGQLPTYMSGDNGMIPVMNMN